ncbi:protein of unknown function [Pseudomonas inefficax]|uniref:Uncharacterized protein n=1 Tax=Pseudomonas inefficax TaxID=2078786 RepID=A0AAQ1P632_9PSED|nr:protein of unknown function [Pseudomonas inefficax]
MSVQVQGQISDMHASGTFLASFEPGYWKLNLSGQHLSLKHIRRQVREIVGAYLLY